MNTSLAYELLCGESTQCCFALMPVDFKQWVCCSDSDSGTDNDNCNNGNGYSKNTKTLVEKFKPNKALGVIKCLVNPLHKTQLIKIFILQFRHYNFVGCINV
jgi:hypothetical protein